jgi:streptomycin 6-kinase
VARTFLKITPDAEREAAALRAFAGRGCVALLDYDPAASSLLLQRAEPGTQLASLCETDDVRATSIAAGVIRALPREVHPFPSLHAWLAADDTLAAIAAGLRDPSREILLHGDLHQYNILAHGDRWLAIDPKGVLGEPECELAPLLLNPAPGSPARLQRRLHQLCDELSFDRQRSTAWSFVRASIAVLWAIEDEGEAPAEWVECVRLLRDF